MEIKLLLIEIFPRFRLELEHADYTLKWQELGVRYLSEPMMMNAKYRESHN